MSFDFPSSIRLVRNSVEFPTSVRLSKSLKARLKRRAKAQGCSFTALVSQVLEQWVEWCEGQEKKK